MVVTNKIVMLFGIMIISVLIAGIYITQNSVTKSSRSFLKLSYAVLLFLGLSFIGEFLDGHVQLTALSFIINMFIYLAVDMTVIAFADYLNTLIEHSENKNIKAIRAVMISSVIRMLLIVILSVTGKLFVIEDGCYVGKELEILPYIISGVIMIELLIAVIINRKCFLKRDFVVIVIYVIIPIIAVGIELATSVYVCTPIAVTVSTLMMYVMIQAVEIEQGKLRETLLEEISSMDPLTELNNRRAFYKNSSKIEPNENIGILFCDINGLKETNDTYGHAKGDALIVRFAGILTGFFGAQGVYRISGDEFVVLLRDINNEKFVKMAEDFDKILDRNDSIASAGYAYGTAENLERLLREAEDFMYENKRDHHKRKILKL